VSDFWQDQTGGELAGDIAYLRVDDEVQMQRMTMAFMQALIRVGGMQPVAPPQPERKVIDTTDPDFIKNFKGLIKGKPPTS
jgi:hypothetical protein